MVEFNIVSDADTDVNHAKSAGRPERHVLRDRCRADGDGGSGPHVFTGSKQMLTTIFTGKTTVMLIKRAV